MTGTVTLKSGKEILVQRRHPWIFSGAIAKVSPGLTQGQVVDVISAKGDFLGKGHYQHGGSIVVRVLSFENVEIDQKFWNGVLKSAFDYRSALGLAESSHTNAYRLIHGEGDCLPGLVIDVYDKIIVVQCHSIGMYLHRQEIAIVVRQIYADKDISIYCRSKDTLPQLSEFVWEDGFLLGEESEIRVQEHGHFFQINIIEGQKTGFFLDQRENRYLLATLSPGKKVLNTFCYTGGFSVYALKGGATSVDSVDISAKAMALTDINISLNTAKGTHQSHVDNVLNYLQHKDVGVYDVVVVDPPAFAKSLAKRHNAIQAYKRLNIAALEHVSPGGFLMTFSCSQVVTPQLFYDTIVSAGMESGRNIRVVKHLSQGGDHPVHLFHPEGHYLKGLLLYVE